MMIFAMMVVVLLFAALFEIITWKYFVKRWKSKPLKICYWVITGLSYIVALTTPLIGIMGITLWFILQMFVNIGIKKAASIVAAIGWLNSRKKAVRPRWIPSLAWMSVVGVVCVFVYGATFGKSDIRVEKVEIVSNKIPLSFDGYKIALFSDLHIGNLIQESDYVDQIVETINGEKPDLIVQSGDLVNLVASELTEKYIKDFSKLYAPDGVVSVLGNHDLGFYIQDTSIISPKATVEELKYKQRELLGWKLLENENFTVYRGGDKIDIAGVTYPKNLNHNNFNSDYGGSDIKKSFYGLSDSVYRVFITHNPKLFDSLPNSGRADLVLSGHVHSMQMAITIFGKKISPASLIYDKFSGLYENDGMKLYINDGVGFVGIPFRIGARPEVTVFTLRSKQ